MNKNIVITILALSGCLIGSPMQALLESKLAPSGKAETSGESRELQSREYLEGEKKRLAKVIRRLDRELANKGRGKGSEAARKRLESLNREFDRIQEKLAEYSFG